MSDDDIQIIGTSAESFDLTQKGIKRKTTICIEDPPSNTGYYRNWDIGKKRSPRADLNKRESKRRRTGVNAHKASFSTTNPRFRNVQDRKAPQEYITISSDEDEDLVQRFPLRAESTKPLKRSISPEFPPLKASPVPSSQKRWKADDSDGRELNSEEEEEEAFENMLADAKYRSDDEVPRIELPENMSSLRLEDSTPSPKKRTIRMMSKQIQCQESSDSDELDGPLLPWRDLHAMHPLKKHRRRIRLSGIHNRLFVSERNIMKTVFKKSSGPVGRIAQRGGNVAIASCVVGGSPDGPNEAPNHHNKSGSLVVWEKSSSLPLVLHGHQSVLRGKQREPWTKHYSVNDAQFEPHGTALVSAGNDKKVHIWNNWDIRPDQINYSEDDLEALQEDMEPDRDDTPFDIPPSCLLFKPDPRETILAIAEKNITLWHGLPADTSLTFRISREAGEKTLNMLWGVGPTSDYLFASSESEQSDIWKGTHSCFDSNTTRPYFLDADKESGDALALQTDGKTLALFTSTKTTNTMRLYDVSTKQKKAFTTISLPEFRFSRPRQGEDEPEGAVNSAVFSPDGFFLAVARNDNRTHVYDTRMIGRGIVHDFEHTGPSRVLPGEKSYGYGVTSVGWIQSPSLQRQGLVTGGNDGCVRLWSLSPTREYPENGRILLEADADIGCLSVGDRFQDEHELVVGDSTGQVYIYDGLHMNLHI